MSRRGDFAVREIALAPGVTRPFRAPEWRNALVMVRAGEIDLEDAAGAVARFGASDVLCLAAAPLRALHNRGPQPALLLAISRRRSPATRLGSLPLWIWPCLVSFPLRSIDAKALHDRASEACDDPGLPRPGGRRRGGRPQ
jgi:hypothetical protein